MSIKHQILRASLWMQKHWIVSTLAFLVGTCTFMTRDRTVTWEEEVPLNTGETIVVKRTGRYIDFDYDLSQNRLGYKPDPVSTIEFTYKGKPYAFVGEPGLLLLAIAPNGFPNLIADPRNNGWEWKNNYFCVVPYYLQLRPDSTGKQWDWPEQIDPWLYGLPTNLIIGLIPLDSDGKKYAVADRALENGTRHSSEGHSRTIVSTYKFDSCKRKP